MGNSGVFGGLGAVAGPLPDKGGGDGDLASVCGVGLSGAKGGGTTVGECGGDTDALWGEN